MSVYLEACVAGAGGAAFTDSPSGVTFVGYGISSRATSGCSGATGTLTKSPELLTLSLCETH